MENNSNLMQLKIFFGVNHFVGMQTAQMGLYNKTICKYKCAAKQDQ